MITRVHAQPPTIAPGFGSSTAIKTRPVRKPAIDTVRFGKSEDIQLNAQAPKKRNLLLPSGTPMFFLHGLSSSGQDLEHMTGYIQEANPNRPIYVSYIPEAHDGQPIENPKDPRDIPSARLALHDIGSFRYQYVRNNLQNLQEFLKGLGDLPEQERNAKLADYFEILPEYRDELAPIIEEFILYPAFQLPTDMKQKDFSRCLLHLTSEETEKLKKETGKLKNKNLFPERGIIDTNTLYNAARQNDREINRDPYTYYSSKKTVNLRPIHFREIAELEGYLMMMEERLTQALTPVMDGSTERARKTTAKLMEKISPQGLALGYSQGGAILQAALMDYLDEGAKHSGELDKAARRPELLAARYIGLGTYFSSPLQGTPRRPQFAVKLFEDINEMLGSRTVFRRLSGFLESFLDWFIWRQKIKYQPSLAEMLEEGSLSKRTRAFFNRDQSYGPATIDDFEGTLLSVADKGDTYVNPESSKLQDSEGRDAINVFNIDVEPFDLPVNARYYVSTPDDLMRNSLGFLGEPGLKLALKLPKEYKQGFYDHFAPLYNQAVRHSALLFNTGEVFTDIGKKVLTNTHNQQDLLNTRNFEPMRYQSLIARLKVLQRDVLSKETTEGVAGLNRFFHTYPGFIHALIDNAREALPVKTSASLIASQVLDETLTLIENVLRDPELKDRYSQPLKAALVTIAEANLPPYAASEGLSEAGLSTRAKKLLLAIG